VWVKQGKLWTLVLGWWEHYSWSWNYLLFFVCLQIFECNLILDESETENEKNWGITVKYVKVEE
jgi:hypothetical protein